MWSNRMPDPYLYMFLLFRQYQRLTLTFLIYYRQRSNRDRNQYVHHREVHEWNLQLVLPSVRTGLGSTGAGHDVRQLGCLSVLAYQLVPVFGWRQQYLRAVSDQLQAISQYQHRERLCSTRSSDYSVQSGDKRMCFILKTTSTLTYCIIYRLRVRHAHVLTAICPAQFRLHCHQYRRPFPLVVSMDTPLWCWSFFWWDLRCFWSAYVASPLWVSLFSNRRPATLDELICM